MKTIGIRSSIALAMCTALAACTTGQKIDTPKPEVPKLLKGVVHKIWIPPEIKNNGQEWVEGHYLFRIERGAQWSR